MISSLRGTLLANDTSAAVIECGGVGMSCYITSSVLSALPKVGKEVFLYTYMSVRDDAIELFGFSSSEERDCFKLITSVSGVGPKIGMGVLSAFTPEQLTLYIASEDAKAISAAPGIGNKTAQRIVLELKDKISSIPFGANANVKIAASATAGSSSKEAVEALVQLGFSASEASLAVGNTDVSLPTEEIIKAALKKLSRRL